MAHDDVVSVDLEGLSCNDDAFARSCLSCNGDVWCTDIDGRLQTYDAADIEDDDACPALFACPAEGAGS